MEMIATSADQICLIDMQDRSCTCVACGKGESDGKHGVPMYEGRMVSNSWPFGWVGVDACPDCFKKQQQLPPEIFEPDYSI